MFLGIEIGGTKLQLGLGNGDGAIAGLWRGVVNSAAGGDGIRAQIIAAMPELFARAGIEYGSLRGVGIGFGGPVDDASRSVIKSHQIEGWDGFPLADWVSGLVEVPAVLGNDADVAGLAEALFGAGKGFSPIFYITVGTGVGGGLIIDGQIYRGVGKGAAEIGHLKVGKDGEHSVEELASGRGIERLAATPHHSGETLDAVQRHSGNGPITGKAVVAAARQGDAHARRVIAVAIGALADGICNMIALLCPRRIVIGGGVSLMGDDLFFEPLRKRVQERVFAPFRGLTDIVPAALGEEVVVHGALALARQKLG
jgi:glucokinase